MESILNKLESNLEFKLGEEQRNALLSIFQFIKNGDTVYEMYEQDLPETLQGKIDHISFVSDNIEADYAYCKEQGYAIATNGIEGIPTFWEKGCRYFKLLTPTGEQVEFCQIL